MAAGASESPGAPGGVGGGAAGRGATPGGRLARARKDAGLTQRQVAAALDVTVNTIWRWERDGVDYGRRATALGELLGVRPAWLTYGDGTREAAQ